MRNLILCSALGFSLGSLIVIGSAEGANVPPGTPDPAAGITDVRIYLAEYGLGRFRYKNNGKVEDGYLTPLGDVADPDNNNTKVPTLQLPPLDPKTGYDAQKSIGNLSKGDVVMTGADFTGDTTTSDLIRFHGDYTISFYSTTLEPPNDTSREIKGQFFDEVDPPDKHLPIVEQVKEKRVLSPDGTDSGLVGALYTATDPDPNHSTKTATYFIASDAPEPSSIILLLCGVGPIVALSRARSRGRKRRIVPPVLQTRGGR